jgi:hypothetical protein
LLIIKIPALEAASRQSKVNQGNEKEQPTPGCPGIESQLNPRMLATEKTRNIQMKIVRITVNPSSMEILLELDREPI